MCSLSAFTIKRLNEEETTHLRVTAASPEWEELSLLIHPLDITDPAEEG
ncbi:MAG: hypothetical protein LIO94_01030 [Clostridiales bacterium]|nr:hypothetical protein [Clostridiales bacterium]